MHIESCMYHLPPAKSYIYVIYLAPKMKNHNDNLIVQCQLKYQPANAIKLVVIFKNNNQLTHRESTGCNDNAKICIPHESFSYIVLYILWCRFVKLLHNFLTTSCTEIYKQIANVGTSEKANMYLVLWNRSVVNRVKVW